MAHTRTAGWRWPGGDALDVWKRRDAFLQAAAAFAPDMLADLLALQPTARTAAEGLEKVRWVRRQGVTWNTLDKHVSIMRERAHTTTPNTYIDGPTTPDHRRAVQDLHSALQTWARRWHLVVPEGSHFIGNWVLEAAVTTLLSANEAEPPQLRQPPYDFASPIYPPKIIFEVEAYSGDEPVSEWRKRWRHRFDERLQEHLDPLLQSLERSELKPIPTMRSENTTHLQWAARWQIGGEHWDAFLEREGLIDSKAANVRDKIRAALNLIGITEREGMRTT